MVREVILVEVVTKSDMSTNKSKTFTNTEKAEDYFGDCVREMIPNIEQEQIEDALDDGFLDCKYGDEEKSVIIKEILFEKD